MNNQAISPATDWENRSVKGAALAAPGVLADHDARVRELRARNEAWWASLPADRNEALKAIKATLHPDYDEYPAGFETVLHLSELMTLATAAYDADRGSRTHDALRWAAELMASSARQTAAELRKMSDVASKSLGQA